MEFFVRKSKFSTVEQLVFTKLWDLSEHTKGSLSFDFTQLIQGKQWNLSCESSAVFLLMHCAYCSQHSASIDKYTGHYQCHYQGHYQGHYQCQIRASDQTWPLLTISFTCCENKSSSDSNNSDIAVIQHHWVIRPSSRIGVFTQAGRRQNF